MTPLAPMLLAVALSAAPADSQPRPLSLDQAVVLAEQNAPQVIAALGEQRNSAAAVRSAVAAFVPSVSLNAASVRQSAAGTGRTEIQNGQVVQLPSEPWSANFGLSATLQLFEGGLRIFNLRQARGRESAARAHQLAQRYAAALNAKQQYFNILAARESQAAAGAQLDQAEQQLRTSTQRVRAKTATRSDSLRAVIQVRSARQAVIDANTALAVGNASLTRAVGTAYAVTAGDSVELPEQPIAVEESTLVRLADQGPAVVGAAADLEASRSALSAAWSTYLPALSASYSRNANGAGGEPWPGGDNFGYSGVLRFSVSLPIFNQLDREQQLTAARVDEQNAIAALRDARLGARENLAQSLGAYRSALERITAGEATLEAAQEDLRMQQERYALGVSTQLDVLTSQTQLDTARRDLIRARYDAHVARAELEALTGRDL
jgi:outer membrane protein